MSQPMPTLPGVPEQIARYQLISELGRGSMGHVYLALDPNIDRKVALKIFLPLLKVGVAEQWELRQRFVLEARAAGQLKHPGIVTIFDADTDPDTGLSYLAMEWVNGPSLDDLIRESGPLPVERAVAIVQEVATALDAAHRQGLVHRDVKPANILLEPDGRAKVTDFGIAKLASMSITTTGWIPGSPFYMSPEQIRNEGVDRRSDLYSLGAVLYQCLTGRLPFEADSLAALTHMILEIDPRPVRSINEEVTADLAAVLDRALAKSPDERFDSGRELMRALRLAMAGEFEARAPARVEVEAPDAEAPLSALEPGGTGTVGLPAPGLEEEPVTAADGVAAAGQRAADLAPAEPVPPAPGAGAPPSRRVAYALALLVGLVAVWGLWPVESEPAEERSPLARLVSSAPRFEAGLATAERNASGFLLPAEPPEADPEGAGPAILPSPVATPADDAAVTVAEPAARRSEPPQLPARPPSKPAAGRPAASETPGSETLESETLGSGFRPVEGLLILRPPPKPVRLDPTSVMRHRSVRSSRNHQTARDRQSPRNRRCESDECNRE